MLRTSTKFAFNLIGQHRHTLQCIYDISEYLYLDAIPYTITDNKTSFLHAASASNSNIILNISHLATYDTMVELNHKGRSAANSNMEICNLLVFPRAVIREDIHKKIYLCNHIYLGMYYLEEKYSDKYNYVKYMIEFLRRRA